MKKIISVARQTFLKPFIVGIIPFLFGVLILIGLGLGFNGTRQSKAVGIFSYIGFILTAIIPLFLALFGSVNCYNLLKKLHYTGLAPLLITLLILFMFILLLPIVSWILITIIILIFGSTAYIVRGRV